MQPHFKSAPINLRFHRYTVRYYSISVQALLTDSQSESCPTINITINARYVLLLPQV